MFVVDVLLGKTRNRDPSFTYRITFESVLAPLRNLNFYVALLLLNVLESMSNLSQSVKCFLQTDCCCRRRADLPATPSRPTRTIFTVPCVFYFPCFFQGSDGFQQAAEASRRPERYFGGDETGGDGLSGGTVIYGGQERRPHHARGGTARIHGPCHVLHQLTCMPE